MRAKDRRINKNCNTKEKETQDKSGQCIKAENMGEKSRSQ